MREPGDAESIESVRSISAKRGYALTAGVLLVMMLGGTLPVPLYVLWEKQMGFGPLGVTVVFAAYVVGTLAALLVLGDLSDHVGRRIVLAIAVACAAVSTALFLAATGIGLLIVARVVQLGGFLTLVLLGGFMTIMFRRDFKQAHQPVTQATMPEAKVNG